jgi:hypothetical protein
MDKSYEKTTPYEIPQRREVRIFWEQEIDTFIDFMKSFDSYHSEGKSHDVDINGYHIYLYEGKAITPYEHSGLIHINKV